MIRISTNHDHDEADDAAVISNIKTKRTKIIIKPKRIFINVWGILTFVTNQKNFEIIFVWVLLHSNLIFCGATITIKKSQMLQQQNQPTTINKKQNFSYDKN